MPVSKSGVIDAIGVDLITGTVRLAMSEERDWSDANGLLRDLERKVNSYLDFVHGGQINEYPEYKGKPIEFELYCQFIPPKATEPALRMIKAQLAAQRIEFKVFVGPDRSCPLTL